MQIRRALNQQADGIGIEPDFDVAADLDVGAQRIRSVKECARQPDLVRNVVRHWAIYLAEIGFPQRSDRNEQQMRIVHVEIKHLVVIVTAEASHVVAKWK